MESQWTDFVLIGILSTTHCKTQIFHYTNVFKVKKKNSKAFITLSDLKHCQNIKGVPKVLNNLPNVATVQHLKSNRLIFTSSSEYIALISTD